MILSDAQKERMHKVIETNWDGRVVRRGDGTTMAMLYLLLGELELGDSKNIYAIVTHTYVWARQLGKMFLDEIRDNRIQQNIRYISPDYTLFECLDEKRFIFIPAADVASKLVGYTLADVYYDLGPYRLEDLPPETIRLISTLHARWRDNDEPNDTEK